MVQQTTPQVDPTPNSAVHSDGYLDPIWDALYTTWAGLKVTARSFLRKPSTVQYPDVDMLAAPDTSTDVEVDGGVHLNVPVAERFRGYLDVDLDLCNTCLSCVKACPIDVLEVEGVKVEGHKGKKPYLFNIDMAKCMYCGLCVEPCPSEAIHFTRKFEGSTGDLGSLRLKLVSDEERAKIEEAGRELEAKKAAEKAEKAAKAKAEMEAGGDAATEAKEPPSEN